jgi:hypothetical protein
MILLIQWIFVHLFVDFVLQTPSMVRHKRRLKARSWILYVHCLLQGGLVYLLVAPSWDLWPILLIVTLTHFFIDLWKLHQKDNIIFFVVDQVLHLVVLFVVWSIFISSSNWLIDAWKEVRGNINVWLIASGYLAVTFPLSFLLYYATQRWRISVEQGEWRTNNSLGEAGKWIGIFERLLVYTFVISNHFDGIGFLIAAKSVLRFNDIKGSEARKETEYVLIGTLMSFASSIIIGLIVRLALKAV